MAMVHVSRIFFIIDHTSRICLHSGHGAGSLNRCRSEEKSQRDIISILWVKPCDGTIWSKVVGWLVVLRINVDLAIFQPYLDLEAISETLKPGIEPRSSCSASQELNHSATAAPWSKVVLSIILKNVFPIHKLYHEDFQTHISLLQGN